MNRNNLWVRITLIILVSLLMAACQQATAESENDEPPAVVEPIAGTEFNRVTLTAKAAARLGIQTGTIHEETMDGAQALVAPYAAILYGLNGETWVYTVTGERTYVRAPITVDYIKGDWVAITDGPAEGTEVVTIGVAELYGADTGVGK